MKTKEDDKEYPYDSKASRTSRKRRTSRFLNKSKCFFDSRDSRTTRARRTRRLLTKQPIVPFDFKDSRTTRTSLYFLFECLEEEEEEEDEEEQSS